jgi:hypothetical protein
VKADAAAAAAVAANGQIKCGLKNIARCCAPHAVSILENNSLVVGSHFSLFSASWLNGILSILLGESITGSVMLHKGFHFSHISERGHYINWLSTTLKLIVVYQCKRVFN